GRSRVGRLVGRARRARRCGVAEPDAQSDRARGGIRVATDPRRDSQCFNRRVRRARRRGRRPGLAMKLSTRMMLAMVSLVLVTASIIGWLNIGNIESVVLPRALGALQAQANLMAFELEASVRSARSDALGFRSAVAVDGMMRATRSQ